MLYRPSPQDGLAWHEASDEDWASYAAAVYAAAVRRGEDDQDTGTPQP